MCDWVEITDANGNTVKVKTNDCNYCGCNDSARSGQHSFYNGVCLQCNKKE